MSHNNAIPVRITPIRDENKDINYNITTTKYTLNEKIKEDTYAFDHRGTYVIKSSSCMYDDDDDNYKHHGPFVAFNNYNTDTKKTRNDFFISDVSGSSSRQISTLPYPKYTQNPYAYAFSGPGTYQGGGAAKNSWSTPINGSSISGEWIQIKLPDTAGIFLFKYTILVPNNWRESISFPKKFIVAGSNDGVSWDFVDQQNLSKEPDVGSQIPIEFNLNSSKKYIYFRLIVTEIFEKHEGVFAIKQWGIYGMPSQMVNRDVVYNEESTDGFTNMDGQYEPYSISNYSKFNLSKPLMQIETIEYKPTYGNNSNSNSNSNSKIIDNTDIYIGTAFAFLAMGIWIYSAMKK